MRVALSKWPASSSAERSDLDALEAVQGTRMILGTWAFRWDLRPAWCLGAGEVLLSKLAAKGLGVGLGLGWGLEVGWGWGWWAGGIRDGQEAQRYGHACLSQRSGVRPAET